MMINKIQSIFIGLSFLFVLCGAQIVIPSTVPAPVVTSAPNTIAPIPAPSTSAPLSVAAPVVSPTSALPTIRINVGAKTVNINGVRWTGDKSFPQTDGVRLNSCPKDINGTDLDVLFCSERYYTGPKDTVSAFNVPIMPGSYKVNLMFAETYFDKKNRRRFAVKVQGNLAKKGVDIAFLVGINTAYILSANAVAPTPILPETMSSIKIEFVNNLENSKINAIEIIPL